MTSEPAAFTIGVAGHRTLPAAPAFRTNLDAAVGETIVRLRGADAAARVVVVSALAEGADRLVVESALARVNVALEAVLPMVPAVFEHDFASEESRTAFRSLLARAETVTVVAAAESNGGRYEAAGLAMLARSDVLVAVWDGQPARGPGGTAENVAHALARGLPVVWISTVEPFEVRRLDPVARPLASP